jgi:hypothetical protein
LSLAGARAIRVRSSLRRSILHTVWVQKKLLANIVSVPVLQTVPAKIGRAATAVHDRRPPPIARDLLIQGPNNRLPGGCWPGILIFSKKSVNLRRRQAGATGIDGRCRFRVCTQRRPGCKRFQARGPRSLAYEICSVSAAIRQISACTCSIVRSAVMI